MIGLKLFARSRHLTAALAALIAIHIIGIGLHGAQHQPHETSDAAVPWLIFLPLLSACIIGVSLRSNLYDLDLTSARALGRWRLAYVVGTTVLAAAGVIVLTGNTEGPAATIAAVRNLTGFVGLALIAGRFLGSSLAWTAPTGYAFTVITLGDPRGAFPPWDWAIRYDSDVPALVAALLLAGMGLIVAATGSKDVRAQIA